MKHEQNHRGTKSGTAYGPLKQAVVLSASAVLVTPPTKAHAIDSLGAVNTTYLFWHHHTNTQH